MRKLTLEDITEPRAYERERERFRAEIIATKRRRRIALGMLLTLVFENRQTVRFQVQEMVRAERMLSDEAVAHEVETYNALIPDECELSATLFIELTSEALLAEWLPKFVGVQRAVGIRLGDGSLVVGEPQDEDRLTREEITTTVHYLKFRFTPEQRQRFCAESSGGVAIVVHHREYGAEVVLTEEQHRELVDDLGEGGQG